MCVRYKYSILCNRLNSHICFMYFSVSCVYMSCERHIFRNCILKTGQERAQKKHSDAVFCLCYIWLKCESIAQNKIIETNIKNKKLLPYFVFTCGDNFVYKFIYSYTIYVRFSFCVFSHSFYALWNKYKNM